MCNNECISEGVCRHNEECYDDLCFTSEQMKVVEKWLAENRDKTIDEFTKFIDKHTHDSDCEICLDNDITILAEEFLKGEQNDT